MTALLQWAATRRFASIALRACRRRWKPLVRLALPIGLAGALVTVYYRIDSVLIFELKGAEEAGIYGAAYRFLDPIQFVPVSILAAVFPVMAAVYVQDPERVRRLVQRAGDYLLVVALGVLGGTVALAQPIVDLLLGPSYERSATVLPILMLAFVFISMGYLSGYLTTIVGKQWRLAAIAAGGVVANVALNFALISCSAPSAPPGRPLSPSSPSTASLSGPCSGCSSSGHRSTARSVPSSRPGS